jgi:hypothetical protein
MTNEKKTFRAKLTESFWIKVVGIAIGIVFSFSAGIVTKSKTQTQQVKVNTECNVSQDGLLEVHSNQIHELKSNKASSADINVVYSVVDSMTGYFNLGQVNNKAFWAFYEKDQELRDIFYNRRFNSIESKLDILIDNGLNK